MDTSLSKVFLSDEEVEKLYQVAIDDSAVSKNAINVNDSTGKRSKLSLWYKPGNDSYGLLTRSEQLVESVDQLLDTNANGTGRAVCHFHSKLMQKEPRVGAHGNGIRIMATGTKTNSCCPTR